MPRQRTAYPCRAVQRALVEGGGLLPVHDFPELTQEPTRVLLVEDNVVNRKVFSAMLAVIGYGVEIAVSGADALVALDRNHYDIVFMDCQMPGMDGCQTTAALRRREGTDHHTHVVAVTAPALTEAGRAADRARCLAAGMDDYMTKPIGADDLMDTLDYWVHGIRARPRCPRGGPALT